MDETYSDAELLAALYEAGLWVVRGGRAEVLCHAMNLRSALVRAFEYEACDEAVLAIMKSPHNQIVILPEQIRRLCQHIRFAP